MKRNCLPIVIIYSILEFIVVKFICLNISVVVLCGVLLYLVVLPLIERI